MPESVCIPVLIVHPSRLFSEALADVLTTAPLRLEHVSTDINDVPFEKLSGSPLFIVGGRTPGHLADNVRNIKECLCCSRVVAIGSTSDLRAVMMALEAGAVGYLHEEMAVSTLIMALKLVLRGETVLPSDAVSALAEYGKARSRLTVISASLSNGAEPPFVSPEELKPNDHKFSKRQATVLKALIDGLPNKVIAQKLQLSEATVKLHVKTVLRKINVSNRTQAAVWATKQTSAIDIS